MNDEVTYSLKHNLFKHLKKQSIFSDSYEGACVFSLVHCKVNNLLYAGCNDGKIYVFSLEDGKVVTTMEGHTRFIHDLSLLYVLYN